MLKSFRNNESVRFLLILGLLTTLTAGAVLMAGLAEQYGNPQMGVIGARLAVGLAVVIVLYVIAKLAQSISLHSDVSLSLTNGGLVFAALILLVGILALSSGNNLLYLVLAVLAATMFVSLFGSRLSLSRIRVSLRRPDHIFAGELVPFDVTAINHKRWMPAFSISVAAAEAPITEPTGAARGEATRIGLAYWPILPARTESRSRVERRFARRGLYRLRGFFIGTRFPLGFVEQRRFVEADGEIAVYPEPLAPGDLAPLLRQMQGRLESRVRGSGSDLYAIRPYQSHDHHHHIDWKATAKTATLMVREFTREDDLRVAIVFDPRVTPDEAARDGFEDGFERAVAAAAGFCRAFIHEGGEVRLVAGADDSGYGMGETHLYAMLRQLAAVAPDSSTEWEREPARDDPFRIVITPRPEDVAAPNTHVITYDALETRHETSRD
jgi:uncharacterized protein (DUF58 family)